LLTFVYFKRITNDSDGPIVATNSSILRVKPSITEIKGRISSDWLLTTPLKGDDTAASKSGSSEGATNNQQVMNDNLMLLNRSLVSPSAHQNPPPLLNPEFDCIAFPSCSDHTLGSCSMPKRR
jgi:hypothetical protein